MGFINKKAFSKMSKSTWIFMAILVIGIFLRTYSFSEWLRFNSDQARDAEIIREMVISGAVPLLGPVAGGTQFKLGPVFYYFQYVSAEIFGAFPDKMAYPDLIFGIAAIPLFYFLARQFFKKNISLMLMALYAVTFFTIQYSRFAWNPNSAQFFDMIFIYSILRIWREQANKKTIWLILAGVSLGISMQLHTLLLFGMPFASLILAIYLFKNKRINALDIALIVFIALMLNGTQIISELRTGGANYLEFKNALVDKSDDQNPLWKNALFIASCQAQSNVKILVPYTGQEDCDFPLADKYLKRLERRNADFADWFFYVVKIVTVIIFSGGSLFLLYRKIKKDILRKKKFIILILFNLALLSVFVPFGAEISLRYFIVLAFTPFILLGLWLEFLLEQGILWMRNLALIVEIVLVVCNLFFSWKTFQDYSRNIPGNMADGTAKQMERITSYLIEEAGNVDKIQISGQKIYLGRFFNRVSYFANNKGIEIIPVDENTLVDKKLPMFYIINEMSKKCEIGVANKYGTVDSCKKIYDVAILKIDMEISK